MIACGFDVHRAQITFDLVDQQTGELRRGRIVPATREQLRLWLSEVETARLVVAVEGTTGWRFVAEEVEAAGARVVLAEPGETRALRGPKRRAKTDRADARWLRRAARAWRVAASPGSHRSTCSSCAAGCACARRWPTSAVLGCSACTHSSFITGSRSAANSLALAAAVGSSAPSSRPPAAPSPRRRWPPSTSSTPGWQRSTTSCGASLGRIRRRARSVASTASVT